MLRGRFCLILAATFVTSSARCIVCKDDQRNWAAENPFRSFVRWYMKHAQSVSVQVIHKIRLDSMHRHSSALIPVLHENTEATISVVHHYVSKDAGDQKERRRADRRHFANQTERSLPILLSADAETLHAFLDTGDLRQQHHVAFLLIILIPEESDSLPDEEAKNEISLEMVTTILRRLWTDFEILNSFLWIPNENDFLYSWNPFALGPNKTFGALKRLKLIWKHPNFMNSLSEFVNTLMDMNGYSLKISIFQRVPTIVTLPGPGETLPASSKERKLDFHKLTGLDSGVINTLTSWMNCSPEFHPPSDEMEYGYRMANGSSVGVIGDVIHRRADIGANSVFLKDYGVGKFIDFTFPINCESLCVVVPRAGMIPQWLTIFQCFSPFVWGLLLWTVIGCGILRYVIRAVIGRETGDYNFSRILAETALIFVSAPQRLPIGQAERVFITFFLLYSVIIVGSFQGTLYQGFAKPAHFKDIDTLVDLDKSGILIGTTSPNLRDIFGLADDLDDTPTLLHLRQKVQVSSNVNESTIQRTAMIRDIAAVERRSDLLLTIQMHYLDDHDESVLHIVEECPMSYYLVYLVPSGAFFLKRANSILQRMFEAGLPGYWYRTTVDALITKYRYHVKKKNERKKNATPFSLRNLQIAFIILILGLLISVLVLIGEINFRSKTLPVRAQQSMLR